MRKQLTTHSLFLFFFFWTHLISAQVEHWKCATTHKDDFQEKALNCTKSSPIYNEFYRLQQSYYPTNANIPIKTIPINIVIFGEDNGTGFPISETSAFLNKSNYESWLNSAHRNSALPNYPPSNPMYIQDSKLKFEIKNFYFYKNSSILNDSSYLQQSNAIEHHLFQNPNAISEINCYLLKKHQINGAAGWAETYIYNGVKIPYILSGSGHYNYGSAFEGEYFYIASHLPHEIGHLLGLWHTYQDETLNPTNIDFLDDVFNTSYYISPNLSNNLMGGMQDNKFISPKQMGRMHRSLSTDLPYSNWIFLHTHRNYVKPNLGFYV